ncbi:MAG: hypothetical protein NTZ93_02445 [Candidatus Beckwithbacteria bacterium]|nr:hypothetical protein [Candidatus Beckwithbacteria bacterium]
MIYKRFELSQSLNGDHLVYIARNSAGIVVFREASETKLKKTIDRYLKQQQQEELLASQKKTEKSLKKGLFAKKNPPQKPKTIQAEAPTPPTRITRTQDGKFISKSQLEKAELSRKKHFWG